MKKILIVEDEFTYITLLRDQLIIAGYDVISAKNGKHGLDLALKEKPALIILDIKMPVMDGLTMLDLLRQNPLGKLMKVIMLTNLEPDINIINKVIKDYLAYYFIKSDIKLKDLLEKIKEVLIDNPTNSRQNTL